MTVFGIECLQNKLPAFFRHLQGGLPVSGHFPDGIGKGGRVVGYEGIGIRWKEPGLFVPSNAEDVPGTEFRLVADTVIEAIGQGVLDRFEGVATDDRGLIVVEADSMATSAPGVFAAGDVVNGGATAVQAVAEGKRAAAGIAAYLDPAALDGPEGGDRS